MTSILQKLDSQEAILLMYLADELPAADRAEVDRRLAAEPALRAELLALRLTHEQVMAGLEQLDAADRHAQADDLSARRIAREMSRRQVELAARPAVVAPAWRRRSWPWWAYSAASAAAMVFIIIGLWGAGVIDWIPDGSQPPKQRSDHGDIYANERPIASDAVVFAELQRSFGTGANRLDDADAHLRSVQNEDEEFPAFPTL
jgi:anti-sigma factor RsiW